MVDLNSAHYPVNNTTQAKMDQRLVEIRDFFSALSLSPNEARYLKMLCSSIKTDIINDLPVEIVALISLHLDISDLANCLQVCKAWRSKLLSDHVIQVYGRARWPNLRSNAETPSSFIEALVKLGWFRRRCLYVEHMISFQETDPSLLSLAELPLDAEYHVDTERVPPVDEYGPCEGTIMYSHGKVAWTEDSSNYVCVDDLRLRTRKVFTVPSGILHGTLTLEAFGSKLAVATIGRLIIAWNHTNNTFQEKHLPCLSEHCTTHDDKVGLLLHDGDIFVWNLLDHKLTRIDTSPAIRDFAMKLQSSHSPTGADLYSLRGTINMFSDSQRANSLYLAATRTYTKGKLEMVDMQVLEVDMIQGVVNSWSISEPLPTDYASDILIRNYEIERNCIIFVTDDTFQPVQVFDRYERRWCSGSLSCQDYLLSYPRLDSEWFDLDFHIFASTRNPVFEYIKDSSFWRRDNLTRYRPLRRLYDSETRRRTSN
ncbi:hypothetical protein GGR57DRAFT_83203 [Xylariaceae sp. FL1272]|nr:hypothetical protein GGR57DRAFT_83203 [Xylariaceae sp. FL1272]